MGNWTLPPRAGTWKSLEDLLPDDDKEGRRGAPEGERHPAHPVRLDENHGDAQPYGEDVFIVTRMCEMIAQKTGCTVAEPLWYASHPFAHLGRRGPFPSPTT